MADQNFTSITPADVTDLSFPVTAGHYYRFEFNCLVSSTTTNTGVAASVTVPAFTRFGAMYRVVSSADTNNSEWAGSITASDDFVVPSTSASAGEDHIASINGLLIPSASGILQLRGRTETGTGPVTFRQGSVGFLWDFGV